MRRQVPQETLFKTNSLTSWQDPNKKNRYHFKFPNNWITTNLKDSIVGIRSLYLVPSHKRILLTFRAVVQRREPPEPWYEVPGTAQLFRISKFFDDSVKMADFINKFNATLEIFNPEIMNPEITELIYCYYRYVSINDSNNECQFVFESPYNQLDEAIRTEITSDGSGVQTYHIYKIKFEIKEINDDARRLLRYTSDERADKTDPIITHGIYDYNQCILYSSLVYMADDSFLGHTRHYTIDPIKYYELKNNNQSFWVDLYSTTDHKTAVELNEGDNLYIEAQLLTSNEAIL